MVPETLRQRSWIAVRGEMAQDQLYELYQRLGLWPSHRGLSLDEALREGDDLVLALGGGGWAFILGRPGGAHEALIHELTQGTVCAFTIDEARDRYRCLRIVDGQLVRSVEGHDGAIQQLGRVGRRREPAEVRADAQTVLDFAQAWGCDPREALTGRGVRVWLLQGASVARSFTQRGRGRSARSGADARGRSARSGADARGASVAWWEPFAWLLALAGGMLLVSWCLGMRLSYSSRHAPQAVGRAALTGELTLPRPTVLTEAACRQSSTCSECSGCAFGAPCRSELLACLGHPGCLRTQACFQGCSDPMSQLERTGRATLFGDPRTCLSACGEEEPEGARIYASLRTCVACTCGDLCPEAVHHDCVCATGDGSGG